MQLIIPALNEERRLPETLHTLRAHLLAAKDGVGPVEAIVVDNASTDRTSEVARRFDSPAMRVRVLHCSTRGKGSAVRAGMAVTDADVVGFMDADGATHLRALTEAARFIEAGADVAVGSRALPESITWERHTKVRAMGAGVYRRLTQSMVPDVVDTQCGFKVFRGDLGREVLAATHTDGFSFDVEVLARCVAAGADVVEFPVTWIDVPGSTFNPARHGVSSFAQLAGIALRMRRVRAQEAARAQRIAVLPTQRPPVPESVSELPLAVES